MRTAVVIAALMAAATAEYFHVHHQVARSCLLVTTTIHNEVLYWVYEEGS
jgi:hypothetical protein